MLMNEDGDWDNMDGNDWIDFIDEYHCVDYWIYTSETYDFSDDEVEDD